MTTYTDATGYLFQLRNDINTSWFIKICDLVLDATSPEIDQNELGKLVAIFTENLEYSTIFPEAPAQTVSTHTSVATTNEKLEKLSNFNNFKKLSDGLEMDFSKRITLVFGTNGSGKSSICQAIKLLGVPDNPDSPIANVRNPSAGSVTSFDYKFTSNSNVETWNNATYGVYGSQIKFFDSKLAFAYIQNPVKPEHSIEITPFRLEIFEYLKGFLMKFQNTLSETIRGIKEPLDQQIRFISDKINGVNIDDNTPLIDVIKQGKIDEVNDLFLSINDKELSQILLEKKAELEQIK